MLRDVHCPTTHTENTIKRVAELYQGGSADICGLLKDTYQAYQDTTSSIYFLLGGGYEDTDPIEMLTQGVHIQLWMEGFEHLIEHFSNQSSLSECDTTIKTLQQRFEKLDVVQTEYKEWLKRQRNVEEEDGTRLVYKGLLDACYFLKGRIQGLKDSVGDNRQRMRKNR